MEERARFTEIRFNENKTDIYLAAAVGILYEPFSKLKDWMDLDMGMSSHIPQLQALTICHNADCEVFGFGREGVAKHDSDNIFAEQDKNMGAANVHIAGRDGGSGGALTL